MTQIDSVPVLSDEIQVSVVVTSYNQVTYINKCLESILSQNTNFCYEIVVHDDASTDGTAAAIEHFVSANPDRFVPILRSENIYSKGISPFVKSFEIARGKYVAICEGDDYWIAGDKLQRQFDIMEKNPSLSFCCHNANTLYVDKSQSSLFNDGLPSANYSMADLFKRSWFVPTASLFIRKELLDDLPMWFSKVRSQDLALQILVSLHGRFWYDAKVMSVYRKNAIGSISSLQEKPWNYLKLRLKLMMHLYRHLAGSSKLYPLVDLFKTVFLIVYVYVKASLKKSLVVLGLIK